MASVRQRADELGFAPEEIASALQGGKSGRPSSRRGTTVPIKYANPGNPSETWSGRGKRPRWMQRLITEGRGRTPEDFRIP